MPKSCTSSFANASALPVASAWNDSLWSLPKMKLILELLPLGDLRDRCLVHRAARQHDGLALEIAQRADVAAAADEELRPRDEHRRRESDDLASVGGIGRRSAFEVDLAGADELDPVLGRDRA
jgi:hypothetical protein